MKDSKRRFVGRVATVFVKLRELPGSEQSFVDNRLRRKRTKVTSRGQKRFCPLPHQRQTAFKLFVGVRCVKRRDKELPDLWHRLESAPSQAAGICRNLAPPQKPQPFSFRSFFDCTLCLRNFLVRQKRNAKTELHRELDAQGSSFGREKCFGN